jgi:hypothetical protein
VARAAVQRFDREANDVLSSSEGFETLVGHVERNSGKLMIEIVDGTPESEEEAAKPVRDAILPDQSRFAGLEVLLAADFERRHGRIDEADRLLRVGLGQASSHEALGGRGHDADARVLIALVALGRNGGTRQELRAALDAARAEGQPVFPWLERDAEAALR